jgi:hypothetical protein
VVPTVQPLRLHLRLKLRQRLSSMCTDWYNANDLMKPHVSIRVVRMWCEICTDPILRCFDNPEGLNYGNLLVGMVPELTSWLTV